MCDINKIYLGPPCRPQFPRPSFLFLSTKAQARFKASPAHNRAGGAKSMPMPDFPPPAIIRICVVKKE